MLIGTVVKSDKGSLSVLCTNGVNSSFIPLIFEQWEMVSISNLTGKKVHLIEIIKGGGAIAHIILPHSDPSAPLVTQADAQQLAIRAFYDGRIISRMQDNSPIFKFSTFDECMRSRKE
jgi:hypothetical protein